MSKCLTSPYLGDKNFFSDKANLFSDKANLFSSLQFCPILLQENGSPLLLENGKMIKL